jgi:hypothetical protein
MFVEIISRFATEIGQLSRHFTDIPRKQEFLAFANANNVALPGKNVHVSGCLSRISSQFPHANFNSDVRKPECKRSSFPTQDPCFARAQTIPLVRPTANTLGS